MATAATKRTGAGGRRAVNKKTAAAVKKKATRTARRAPAKSKQALEKPKEALQAVTPGGKSPVSGLARFAAKKALKAVARRAANSSANLVRAAADRTALTGKAAMETALSKRLPIQVSIDVAVPLEVAWAEWMGSETLTEGIHRIVDLVRDGDSLYGTVAGPRSSDWEAKIVDEREHESFAWRSHSGSDCAGLVTFHQLSERLTRIELDLDVLPTNPAQALSMSLHLAHRHAEAELRRFKARVEFINPDVYEPELRRNGHKPETEQED
jgi:uncharacterized membrane protein